MRRSIVMDRVAYALIAAVVVLAAVHFFVFPLDRLLMLITAQRTDCLPGDVDCAKEVASLRNNCTPSVSTMVIGNATNNITVRLTTYMKDGKCVTEEIVLDDSDSGIAPFNITGYNTTCEVEEERLDDFGQHSCNGSLTAFVSPDDGGSAVQESGDEADDEYVYKAYCSLDAEDCQEEAASHITQCMEAEILMDMQINHSQGGVSYWSIFIDIEQLPVEYTDLGKLPERCSMYHELVDAVNLPPEIPPSVIGMNMTCTIPMSEFPISGVTARDCTGDLMEYIQLIYP